MSMFAVGRKSGGLKASDPLIDFILNELQTSAAPVDGESSLPPSIPVAKTYGDALRAILGRIEPLTHPERTDAIRKQVPGVGRFHVPLPLVDALVEYDSYTRLLHRCFVAPTFREIRHILNIAAIDATVRGEDGVRLVTLDADETIYSDGGTVSPDSPMVPLISRLLTSGVRVSLVTAAGYTDPTRYEQRLSGLLRAFELAIELGADPCFLDRFFVMGGEANYFLVTELEGRPRLGADASAGEEASAASPPATASTAGASGDEEEKGA